MWTAKYKVIKIMPGVIIMPGFGRIDLSDTKLAVDLIDRMYAAGCPYLKLIEKTTESISLTNRQIIEAIDNAKTKVEAKKYADMKPDNAKIQRAYQNKLCEFEPELP